MLYAQRDISVTNQFALKNLDVIFMENHPSYNLCSKGNDHSDYGLHTAITRGFLGQLRRLSGDCGNQRVPAT